MKITFEIELGNDAMQEYGQVGDAIERSLALLRLDGLPVEEGDEGKIRDENGNTVGSWRAE